MASSSDRLDLNQLRTRAKELKRAFEFGDENAAARVLASHPKFAGRPAGRLEEWHLTLRDAQATIAREHGFDSWKALTANLGGTRRWDASASSNISRRAFAEAHALRHGHCIDLHFLLALLKPPAPTAAAAKALKELGVTYEEVRRQVADRMRGQRRSHGVSSTPTYQLILGWAQGIAIVMGDSRLTDEHVLLAILYEGYGGSSRLDSFDIDPDEVVERLRADGIQTPRVEPPAAEASTGPQGPWVYFPEEDWGAVTQELVKDHPPGTAHWGTNRSKWKMGHWYVIGEDTIPMEAIVRRAVKNSASVQVMSFSEGSARESATDK
jgi:ClpA/ClpB-like protein